MFKKLKAKIEEGGDSGIENVSFSQQRKLPGSAVRTLSTDSVKEQLDVSLPSRSTSPASRDEDQDEGVAVPPSPHNSLRTNSVRTSLLRMHTLLTIVILSVDIGVPSSAHHWQASVNL